MDYDIAIGGTYAAVDSFEADRDIIEDLHPAGAAGRFTSPIVSVRIDTGEDDFLIPPPRGASIWRWRPSGGRRRARAHTPIGGGDREPKEPRQ